MAGLTGADDRIAPLGALTHDSPAMPSPDPALAGAPPAGLLDRLVRHRAIPWLVLGVSVVTCLAGWYHGSRVSHHYAEQRFQQQADAAADRLQRQLDTYEEALKGAAAFVRSVPELDRRRWREYVSGLGSSPAMRGLAGIGFMPRVPHDAIDAHRTRLRGEGFTAYDVWPASTRAEHYPVAYLEPESDGYRRALGFDVASDPARLEAIERARDTGTAVLSDRVQLRPDPRDPTAPAFALLLPVYAVDRPLGSPAQRRAAMLGVVHASFRLNDFLDAALGHQHLTLGLALRERAPADRELHRDRGFEGPAVFSTARDVRSGGRQWRLHLEAGPTAVSAAQRWWPGIAVLGILGMNGVLASLLFAQRRAGRRVETLAAEQAIALHRSEGAFMAVAESARVGIVTADDQGRFIYANAAAEQMLGASRDQLRGVSATEYVADADRARFAEGLGKFLAGTGRIASGAPTPLLGRRHSGEEFHAEISLSWFETPEGHRITGVLVDLTERLQAEAAAREAEERWKVALESTDDGVWDWDVKAGTLYGSRRLFELVGYESPSGAIDIEGWNALVHEDDLAIVLRDLQAHLAGERDRYVSEYRIRSRDGGWRWLLARGRITARDAQGAPTRVVGTCADITERRHAEETLRFAREQAEQAARSKSDFLAMMSHELRTPMNGVLGMANLLSSTALTDEQREYLEMISRSGNALLRLIDDILDFSKIEAGRVVLEQIPCDVGAIAGEVVTLLGVQAHTRGLALDAHVVPGTPCAVITDPGRIRQILFNLVGNAIKFTEAGAVHVTVGCDQVDAGQATLRITVADSGMGIPEDKQRWLFEKFTQADASTTRRFGGTGLGLAISKGLVESLGGVIGVSSVVGRGSEFWFPFTAHVSAVAVPDSQSMMTEDLDSAASPTVQGPGRRVLVAEDNPVNQRVAVRMLEKLGYAADVAVDGREAVQMAQAAPYAVILMDCHMPEVDGYEATRRIARALPANRRPPIVAMTAAGNEGDRERCLAAGMDDYLGKPVRMDTLRAMLDRWAAGAGVQ